MKCHVKFFLKELGQLLPFAQSVQCLVDLVRARPYLVLENRKKKLYISIKLKIVVVIPVSP